MEQALHRAITSAIAVSVAVTFLMPLTGSEATAPLSLAAGFFAAAISAGLSFRRRGGR